MRTVSIHPPKTPVTKGCTARAQCTTPNVCKMPGPPAPFVPTPLPNTGMSNLSPKGYSKTVKIEKTVVAIGSATFKSIGDIASKGTGGGLISANAHGVTKFIPPGSLTVKIEGKSVHLHGEQMLNNCADGGTPPNTGATLAGDQAGETGGGDDGTVEIKPDCAEYKKGDKKWDECMCAQVCLMVKEFNNAPNKSKVTPSPSSSAPSNRAQYKAYADSKTAFQKEFASNVATFGPDSKEVKDMFYSPPAREGPPKLEKDCLWQSWKDSGSKVPPQGDTFEPDHKHPVGFNGPSTSSNCILASARVNGTVGAAMRRTELGAKHGDVPPPIKAHASCGCDA